MVTIPAINAKPLDQSAVELQSKPLGTGYWHWKVEYVDKEQRDGECKVVRVGGFS